MKKDQIKLKLLTNSNIFFNSNENYNEFQKYIKVDRFQEARFILDKEMDFEPKPEGTLFELKVDLYSQMEDDLFNLIIDEIDGAGRNKQIKSNTRST